MTRYSAIKLAFAAAAVVSATACAPLGTYPSSSGYPYGYDSRYRGTGTVVVEHHHGYYYGPYYPYGTGYYYPVPVYGVPRPHYGHGHKPDKPSSPQPGFADTARRVVTAKPPVQTVAPATRVREVTPKPAYQHSVAAPRIQQSSAPRSAAPVRATPSTPRPASRSPSRDSSSSVARSAARVIRD